MCSVEGGGVGLQCQSSHGELQCRELGSMGSWGAQGWGVQSRMAHGQGMQSRGAQGGAYEVGELQTLCGAQWGPVVGNGACKGALVGCCGVAQPGDMAAKLGPTAWQCRSSGGAQHSDVVHHG